MRREVDFAILTGTVKIKNFLGDLAMSVSIDALKVAVELEKMIRGKYRDAIENATHEETKETLKKFIVDKDQQIDSIHWIIMAEAGKLEKSEDKLEAPAQENGATRLAAGKCPFSKAELSQMGFPVSEGKPHS
ncbi:MAG: hypothetical protein VYC17_05000 [Nitrospinota bacterium]|nr:hypothetical protein [Nitrospinota bacterium]